MQIYIKARTEVFDTQHINSAWCKAGLFLFNPKRALYTIDKKTTPKAETPIQAISYKAFNQVFVNNSPPDAQSL